MVYDAPKATDDLSFSHELSVLSTDRAGSDVFGSKTEEDGYNTAAKKEGDSWCVLPFATWCDLACRHDSKALRLCVSVRRWHSNSNLFRFISHPMLMSVIGRRV
jgi:hypothetical protein